MESDILEGEVLILRRDNQLSSNLESPMGSFFPSIVNKVVKGKKMDSYHLQDKSSKDIKI